MFRNLDLIPVGCDTFKYLVQFSERSGHLYTATYKETRTAAVYNSKWHTDQH